MSFFLAEMGTEGSIDGNMRLVIKGRYQPKQVESLLKKYIGRGHTRQQRCARGIVRDARERQREMLTRSCVALVARCMQSNM